MITKHSQVFSKQIMSFVITAATAGDLETHKTETRSKRTQAI